MTRCPNCSRELPDGAKFCGGCGAKIEKTVTCPHCGMQTSADKQLCPNCGKPLYETALPEQPLPGDGKKKKSRKKGWIFCTVGVLLLAAAAAAVFFLSGRTKKANRPVMYIKDDQIWYTSLKKGSEPVQLTSKMIYDMDEAIYDSMSWFNYGQDVGEYSFVSEDGKYVVYPDKIEEVDTVVTLYRKRTDKPEEKGQKIDKNIWSNQVALNGQLLTYVNTDDALYQYDLAKDEKEKIAEDVRAFYPSEDGKTLWYTDGEHRLYLKKDGNPKKMGKDISDIKFVSDDASVVYFMKGENLCKETQDKEITVIASDVESVINIYETGEVYYLTYADQAHSLMEFIADDMAQADAEAVMPSEPKYPERPYSWDYPESRRNDYQIAYNEWAEEYNRLEEEYEQAWEQYRAKESRDNCRIELQQDGSTVICRKLYYYDGSEITLITDDLLEAKMTFTTASDRNVLADAVYAQNRPVLVYQSLPERPKIPISEITDSWDAKTRIETAMKENAQWNIAVGAYVTLFKTVTDATNFKINADGTSVCFFGNHSEEKDTVDLYGISVSEQTAGVPELIAANVCSKNISFIEDGRLCYLADYDNQKEEGTLCIGQEEIADDVHRFVTSPEVPNMVTYFSDVDETVSIHDYTYTFTLYVYEDGKTQQIAEEATAYAMSPDRSVLYLTEYDFNRDEGELYIWKDGVTEMIDDEVACLVPYS